MAKQTTTLHGSRLSNERISLIVSHYLADNCSNKTNALLAAGYAENTAKYGAWKIFNDPRVKSEIDRQIRPVVAQSQITLVSLQHELLSMVQEIRKSKDLSKYGTAVSAINSLLKTIGGFQSESTPDSTLAGKMLDAKRAEDMRRFADRYYAHRFLADAEALLPAEGEGTDGPEDAIESDFRAEGPLTPQGAGGKIQGGLASQRGGESENRHE